MRDAFLQLLRGEDCEEPVWCADISYWIDGNVGAGKADPALQSEQGHLELCRELGCMPYFWYGKFWAGETRFDNVAIEERREGHRTTTTWCTSVGTLHREVRFNPSSWSECTTKYPVETADDLKRLLALLEHRRLEPANLSDYRERLDLWAHYDGVPCLGLPRSPLPALITEWCGAVNACTLLLEHGDLVREVLACLEAQEQPVIEAVCGLAPPVVHFPDNQTSDIYTPFFEDFMRSCYRKRLQMLHAAGVRCAVHLDGTMRGLLPKLTAAGFDAVEALTPAPAGDAPVEDLRALSGSGVVVLWGGVPGALFAQPYAWADMQAHVEHTLQCFQGQPFILGVGDQVPPNGDLDLCRRISEIVQEFKR